jgi:hypothetical protein
VNPEGQTPADAEESPGLSGGQFIRPAVLAQMPHPWPAEVDCDEMAAYGASLMLAIGVPVQFVTVSTDPKDPMRFNHIYFQTVDKDGRKTPIDLSGPYLGWEPQWYRRKEWPIIMPDAAPHNDLESNWKQASQSIVNIDK